MNGDDRVLMTQKAYAEHRGCAPSRITALKQRGALAPPAITEDGLIDVARADAMLDEALDPAQRAGATEAASYQDERVRKMRAEAELAEIELARRKRELLPASDVERAERFVAERFRELLAARLDGLTDRIVAAGDRAAVRALLEADLRENLAALARSCADGAAEARASLAP